jgi:broad specificity phosphatase PhoE
MAKDAPRPTRVLVVRHGESEWNAVGRWQGQADPPLTETGLLQAYSAGQQLGSFDAVWASDLQRAAHTAAVIADSIGVGPVQLDVRLREASFGPWQGLTRDEIEAGWPGFLAEHRRPEGAEAPGVVVARALDALRHIATGCVGGEALVVSHGGLLRAVRRALGDEDPHVPNLGGNWFVVHADGSVRVGDAVRLADDTVFTEPATAADEV